MPVLINQNVNESCFFLNENHTHVSYKKIIISKCPFHRFITKFLLSFDLNLSCKLQLIDLITVSATCLVGRQTILVCFFFPENCEMGSQENKRDKWMEN